LGRLVAKDEDEYVQLALQLASDVTALSDLRASLRDLMSKSPVCDGANFIRSLESTYRKLWRRYCKGDVPSSRHIEMLQQSVVTQEPAIKISEQARITNSRESPPGSIKINGFSPLTSSMPKVSTSTCEENGGPLNQNISSSKLS
jgi:protein O-GlcNAc transferase